MPENTYVPPMAAERLARELGVPIFWVLNGANLEVRLPRCEPGDALLDACTRAAEPERKVLLSLLRCPENEGEWLDYPAAASLSSELRQRLEDYVNREEVHGPWRLFRHAAFPIEDYLQQLFQNGRLAACANLPGDPFARALTKVDWGGLEMAVGGDLRRLSVWRAGRVAISGMGDFENVQVEREAMLREFPEEPPLAQSLSIPATDDAARAVIRQALADSGGSQENGAEIVRSKIPTFLKKRAMQLVKRIDRRRETGAQRAAKKSCG